MAVFTASQSSQGTAIERKHLIEHGWIKFKDLTAVHRPTKDTRHTAAAGVRTNGLGEILSGSAARPRLVGLLHEGLGAHDLVGAIVPLALQPHEEVRVQRDHLLDPDRALRVVAHHVAGVGVEQHVELAVIGGHPADGLGDHLVGHVHSPLTVGVRAIDAVERIPDTHALGAAAEGQGCGQLKDQEGGRGEGTSRGAPKDRRVKDSRAKGEEMRAVRAGGEGAKPRSQGLLGDDAKQGAHKQHTAAAAEGSGGHRE